MAVNKNLKIIVSMEDKASAGMKKVAKSTTSLTESLRKATLASVGFTAALALGLKSVVKAANDYEKSMIGLSTVSEAFGVSVDEATRAAKSLSDDGLLTITDAAAGLKNLLATGFSLPEAINLMNGFKDSAAFNRQGMLGFGEAIVGATQGLKNQNSIMVDNAGITKNLSIILKEAGMSANDLGLVTSDASVRQALYNGLLRETAIFQGDAIKASESFQGKAAELQVALFNLRVEIGESLLPIISQFIEEALLPMIEKITQVVGWLKEHKEAVVVLSGMIIGALVPAVVAATVAFARLALTLAPFVIAGGLIATLVTFLDYLMKRTTGFGLLEQLEATIWLLKTAFDSVLQSIRAAISAIKEFIGLKGKAGDVKFKSGGGGGSFAHGGVVPGDYNEAVPIIAHGGERVISKAGLDANGSSSNNSSSVTVNFNAPIGVRSDNDIDLIARAVKSVIDRDSYLYASGAY